MMTISVVLTNYNYRSFICAALDSVITNRDAGLLELIVVDDGSHDGSVELLQDYGKRCPLMKLICKENGGQLSAYRAGIRQARGDLICILDSDDSYKTGYFEKLQSVYASHAEVDFVFTNLEFKPGPGFLEPPGDDEWIGGTKYLTRLTRSNIGCQSSCLSMRGSLARELMKLFPESLDSRYRIYADAVLVLGSSILGACKYRIGQPYVNYTVHDRNLRLQQLASPYGDYRAYVVREEVTRLFDFAVSGCSKTYARDLYKELMQRSIDRKVLRRYRKALWRSDDLLLNKLIYTLRFAMIKPRRFR